MSSPNIPPPPRRIFSVAPYWVACDACPKWIAYRDPFVAMKRARASRLLCPSCKRAEFSHLRHRTMLNADQADETISRGYAQTRTGELETVAETPNVPDVVPDE